MAPHCCLIARLRPPPVGEVSGVSPDSLYLLASNGSQPMLNQGISKLVFTINLAYLTLSTFSARLFIYFFHTAQKALLIHIAPEQCRLTLICRPLRPLPVLAMRFSSSCFFSSSAAILLSSSAWVSGNCSAWLSL